LSTPGVQPPPLEVTLFTAKQRDGGNVSYITPENCSK